MKITVEIGGVEYVINPMNNSGPRPLSPSERRMIVAALDASIMVVEGGSE